MEKERIVLIVTSTYNGQAPDTANKFAEYCKYLTPNSLAGVKVAIIGIGNSNWKSFPENNPVLVLHIAFLLNEHYLGRVVTVATNSNDNKQLRHLPFGVPIKVSDLLGQYVDLQAPITATFLNAEVASAVDSEQAEKLALTSAFMTDIAFNAQSIDCQIQIVVVKTTNYYY